MNVGDEVVLKFDEVAPRGDAIATEGAPKPVMASRVVPGEEARVQIRRIRRNWIAVDVLEITKPSEHRVEARCPLFETCAGCQLQHIDYPHQLTLKRTMVRKQLREAWPELPGEPIREVLGAPDPWYYRNHARFTVQEGKLGFVRVFKRRWFEVQHCYIMKPAINAVMEKVHGRLGKATQCNIRAGSDEAPMVQPRFDIEGLGIESGQPHVTQELSGHRFRVSAPAFFQVHDAQAERLVELVAEAIGNDPEAVVVDAYAGVGTFAVLLAERFGKIIAIESSGPAVEDAKVNAAGLDNVELRLGKSEELLSKIEGRVDAVILDPPRSGCLPEALDAIETLRPDKVIYVSCHPQSLGRDLARLCDAEQGHFDLEYIQPLDMFPHTHHVECVALLRRRGD